MTVIAVIIESKAVSPSMPLNKWMNKKHIVRQIPS